MNHRACVPGAGFSLLRFLLFFLNRLAGADITGATGTFTGVVHTSDFISSVTGESMMNGKQIGGEYIDAAGINENNKFIVAQSLEQCR